MELSILLAEIMGLYLIIMSISVLVNKKLMPDLIKDVAKNATLMLFGGAITLILGLFLVLIHNVWTADWVGLITLLSWLVLLKGLVLVIFPEKALSLGVKMQGNVITVSSVIMLVVGIYLTYIGFIA